MTKIGLLLASGEMFINSEQCKFGSCKQEVKCFSTIIEFLLKL